MATNYKKTPLETLELQILHVPRVSMDTGDFIGGQEGQLQLKMD